MGTSINERWNGIVCDIGKVEEHQHDIKEVKTEFHSKINPRLC